MTLKSPSINQNQFIFHEQNEKAKILLFQTLISSNQFKVLVLAIEFLELLK